MAGAARLNATSAVLLGLLHEGPLTGWDLVSTAHARFGDFWSLTKSQVYRELAAMSDGGLIEAGDTGPRDRKPYRVTRAGEAAFAEWLAREPEAESIRLPLLLTVAFASRLDRARLTEILAAKRAGHTGRLDDYLAARDRLRASADVDPARLATLEYGIRHERAVLEWFGDLEAILFPA